MLRCASNIFGASVRVQCAGAVGHLARCQFATATAGERTALYDFHLKSGGKIVNFGGYALPVQYADQGIAASHLHTRRHASIFDVSHMLQTYVHGRDAVACMESVCTADIRGLADGRGTLTVFTNEAGGILDDLIVTRVSGDQLYVVSNAAMKQQDMGIMEAAVMKYKSEGKDVSIEFLPTAEQSLIAVQGPKAVAAVLQCVPAPDKARLEQCYFMHSLVSDIAGVPNCRITRCGYTGEDGVEISVQSARVQHVVEAVLSADGQLKMAGLGARDSLRLEAGLCLYGTDITATTTAIQAGLAWLVAKRRRNELNFPGAEHICAELKSGVAQRRVGLHMTGGSGQPPARQGVQIHHNGELVGHITSGCPSPSLGKNIAMGYIADALKKPGEAVQLKIRDKLYAAEVTKMPFLPTNYFMPASK